MSSGSSLQTTLCRKQKGPRASREGENHTIEIVCGKHATKCRSHAPPKMSLTSLDHHSSIEANAHLEVRTPRLPSDPL
jgi:hypothetical protein